MTLVSTTYYCPSSLCIMPQQVVVFVRTVSVNMYSDQARLQP